ncbi:hypothetical protein [Deinococcus sp.]|uniref:hypothetical protein n=1 Tax=Deinococcus sp. TaxID=47478 RepID=UPI003CC52029
MRSVPTAEDWLPDLPGGHLYHDHARRVYFGKGPEEMLTLLESSVPEAIIDSIGHMPDRPFQYYLLLLADYAVSPGLLADASSSRRASVAEEFFALVERTVKIWPDRILPIMPDLLAAIDFIGGHQKKYTQLRYGELYAKRRRHIYALVQAAQRSG